MTSFLMRFGVYCGILLGLTLAIPAVIEAFTGETTPTSFVIGLGAAFGTPALTAFYLHQRTGTVAYAVNLIGLSLFSCVAFALNLVIYFLDPAVADELLEGPTRLAFLGSTFVFVAGTLMFAVSMLRAKVLPAIPAIGYGISLTLLALLAPLDDALLASVTHLLAGASVIWLSVSVWHTQESVTKERMGAPSPGGRRSSVGG